MVEGTSRGENVALMVALIRIRLILCPGLERRDEGWNLWRSGRPRLRVVSWIPGAGAATPDIVESPSCEVAGAMARWRESGIGL